VRKDIILKIHAVVGFTVWSIEIVPAGQLTENANMNPTKTTILPSAFYILVSHKE
jgi:hypothetical protein